ncbi:MAG: T9SS type A sorting domain-containing protein [Cyclobacteriaceae bacterium]|nr:T9SS type A sorting domain-containing protein [Cyclobacteriaceae bacterium]
MRLGLIYCFILTIIGSANCQVIKFQSAGNGGAVTSSNGTIVHSGYVGAAVSQGAGANNQAGFFFGSVDYRPAVQASTISFSGITTNQLTLNFTRGNGDRRIVVAKAGSAVNAVPAAGTTYTANAAFGSGAQIIAGNYVLFDGGVSDANSVLVTGLNLNTTVYHFKVFEYNGKYAANTSNIVYQPNDAVLNPLASPPTVASSANSFSNIKKNEMTLTWANGNGTTRLLVAKSGVAVDAILVNGQTYTANPAFGAGTPVGTGNFVVYSGSGTSTTITGLSANTLYHYKLIEFNGSSGSTSYGVSALANKITTTVEPTATTATAIAQTGFNANWNVVTGATDYYLDVSTNNFSTYTTGFQNLLVPGTGLTKTVAGLSPGTNYQFRVRALNSSGQSDNSNVISVLTVSATPLPAASNFSQSGFRISWPTIPTAIDYSVDVSQDNFSTLLTGYPKTITALFHDVSDLTDGTNYQYRVRSRNASGTSPSSADQTQITIPANPVSKAFSNETATSFIANWDVVEGAAGYELDVTLDFENFNTFVSGYEAKPVPAAGDFNVTGLTASNTYRYRVRSYNSAGVSGNSLPKLAITKNSDGTGGSIIPTVSLVENQNSQTMVKASTGGGFGTLKITLNHRKITEATFTAEPEVTLTGASHEATISPAFLDEIGMEYFFTVTDGLDKTAQSSKGYVYKIIPSQSIPALTAGGTVSSYRIISVPLKLESTDIRDVFATLISNYGGYNKEKWRLLRYQNGKNTDFDGLTSLGQGKGYWFNSLETVEIKVAGQAIAANQTTPFLLQLEKGWNQVGNPFLFNIDWDDIRTANPTADVDLDYLVFDPAAAGFKKSNSLVSWAGGFIYANSSLTLQIPVTLKNTAGGRKYNATDLIDYSIDQPNWFMPIRLSQGDGVNDYIGFGMHPEAKVTKDHFDGQTVPRFIKYLELNSYHSDEFTPKFSRDVVPTSNAFTWIYTFESNFDGQEARLEWNNELLGDNTAQLFLYDTEAGELINMKKSSSYSFKSSKARDFKFIFSSDDKSLLPEVDVVGKAFPNPFTSSVTIPFIISTGKHVQIVMYDLMGKKIKNLAGDQFSQGYHEVVWDGTDFQNNRAAQGMYLYEMITEGKRMIGRIILQ